MENDPVLWSLLLQIVLIALNAAFACAEIAVISVNDTKLARMAAQGDKRAVRLAHLTSQPARFLATIQVAITLSGFLGSAFAADNFAGPLVSWLVGLGVSVPADTLKTIAVIIITLILSYFTLVFGELVPKRLGMKYGEKLALAMSGSISFIAKLFAPLVWTLTASTNGILRLLGIDPNAEENEVSEEEIRMMVDAGSEKGAIDETEKEFIQNVFEFDDLCASEIATHRTDIDFLWTEETMEQWAQILRSTRHALYPVCSGSVDNIIGVLNAKDYFRLTDKTREAVMAACVRPAQFVPDSVRADVLFRSMKKSGNYFAVVLDEYGGTLGILTMNDLVQQLVGDLPEDDETRTSIRLLENDIWEIEGNVPLEDLVQTLKLRCNDEFDTFSGFIFNRLGYIPKDGAQFDITACGWVFHITAVEEHQVMHATAQREAAPAASTAVSE